MVNLKKMRTPDAGRRTPDAGRRTSDVSKWQFWIDRGGTFTDIVARRPDGSLIVRKLLSEHPERYEDAALEGIRRIFAEQSDRTKNREIGSVRMGSTVATNALLEGTGEPTLLVITRGFGDALRIGYQDRPEIFAREIVLPVLPYADVLEATERIAANGEVIVPLDEARLKAGLIQAYESGFRAAAIVFMHGYRYSSHERRAADIAREAGFEYVSVSQEVAPLIRLISRGDTTVVDAHLTPVVQNYVRSLRAELGDVRLLFMQSSGGLSEAEHFQGKDAVLSGPAGGIVGMVMAGRQAGYSRLIGFDMGGTSTDVSLYDGRLERTDSFVVGGMRMRAPALQMHTVAAGGGSVLDFDGMRLRVGERSAGAIPGPVCYGRNGPLAVTDCHVQLGRLRAEFFPQVFGEHADQPLDVKAVNQALATLAERIADETGVQKSPEELADDFLSIAVQKMAQAVRRISIERGRDPRDFALVAFGGAAGQHACRVADELNVQTILIHPHAGVLSAWGIGSAAVSHTIQHSIEVPLSDRSLEGLSDRFSELEKLIEHRFADSEYPGLRIDYDRRTHLKYEGVDTAFPVAFADRADCESALANLHLRRFGYVPEDRHIVIEAIEIEGVQAGHSAAAETKPGGRSRRQAEPLEVAEVWMDGSWQSTPFYRREDLRPGKAIVGPAVIVEEHATTIVESKWEAVVVEGGSLVLSRSDDTSDMRRTGVEYDPTKLEIFNNLFMHIAEEMGIQLQETARSVNIKERLDFSCALFDGTGDLVANAPHMPVHLGSMSETVRQVLKRRKQRIRPGDAFLTNDPYHGGTHLPDLTVVSPFFHGRSGEPVFFVASRVHHAEIGGISPGSMPAMSVRIDEEGVLFTDVKLVESGHFDESTLRDHLAAGKWPSRNPDANVADLQAQLAANQAGIALVEEMVATYGLDTVRSYMHYIKENAAEAVRRALDKLGDGWYELRMDSGQRIAVTVRVDHDERTVIVDFAGTSEQQANNLNAPRAITTAAVLYVFRTLVDDQIPLNEGCLEPIEIRIPKGSMLDPVFPAAVAGGNVETSQCVVDALLGAMGMMAASQGTMNNLTFGDATDQYYETICGGAGAGPGFDGTSAVHTHMTNSRLTDPEVLESRYPVLLEAFSVRRGSGGKGKWSGGDGAVRRLRFLRRMNVSILSNRRKTTPFGLNGGLDAAPGTNRLERADGTVLDLPARASFEADEGDVLVIETPGGGGYGANQKAEIRKQKAIQIQK